MKTNEEWALFERLSDPELPADERGRLEASINLDPATRERYEAFRSLEEWPVWEAKVDHSEARIEVLRGIASEREASVAERELGRVFPVFFGTALAAVLVVALLNFWQFEDFSDDAFEALFGLPSDTLEPAIVSQL